MNKIVFAAAILGASAIAAFAQTTPAPSKDGNTPAVATPDTKNPTAPVEGANSFTETQAKDRIAEAGYTDVKDLKLDDKGIWMASASRTGKPSPLLSIIRATSSPSNPRRSMMRTVTGLFDDHSDARSAVTKLEAAGFPSNDISIVSNKAGRVHRDSDVGKDAATGAVIGAAVGGAGGLLTGLGLMAIPGVGPVVAEGWLAVTAAGAVAGAVTGGAVGGLIGALTDSGVSEDDAHLYAEGVRRGGSLVTAKVDDARASEAQAILQGSNCVDPVERRRAYKEQGWTHFNDTLDPYAPEQIAQERDRYPRTGI